MKKYSEKASQDDATEDDVEKDLKAAFKVFDNDHNGFITRDELRSALKMIGENPSEPELDQILTKVGCSDGRISYQQFVKILLWSALQRFLLC